MPSLILSYWAAHRDGSPLRLIGLRVEDHDDIDDATEALALAIDEERGGSFRAAERVTVHLDGTVDHEPLDLLPSARERVAEWRASERERRARRVA